MAVVATGGYGRGLLAPGSDIDLLFVLPYKQTASGKSVAEAVLYSLWDMGLKVGHATRSVDECIRQAKADMTIRTAVLEARFLFGDEKLFEELVARFDKNVVQGTAHEFVNAKLAEREERLRKAGQSRYLRRAQREGRRGRLADLHTLFWMGGAVYRVHTVEELADRSRVRRRRTEAVPPLRRISCGRCAATCISSPNAPERLSFDIQREIAEVQARLYRASRHAGCRALHEAFLPDREGCRRSHRGPIRRRWKSCRRKTRRR